MVMKDFFKKLKKEYKLTKAFKELFFDGEKLKPEAEVVISFLREECGGKGELGRFGVPYLYNKDGSFDSGAAAFLLGKRRVFDLIVKHLSLDEQQIFKLMSESERATEFNPEDLDI